MAIPTWLTITAQELFDNATKNGHTLTRGLWIGRNLNEDQVAETLCCAVGELALLTGFDANETLHPVDYWPGVQQHISIESMRDWLDDHTIPPTFRDGMNCGFEDGKATYFAYCEAVDCDEVGEYVRGIRVGRELAVLAGLAVPEDDGLASAAQRSAAEEGDDDA